MEADRNTPHVRPSPRRLAFLPVLFLFAGLVTPAQEPTDSVPGERPGDVRREMKRVFENRLRSELALSDPQMDEILSLFEQLEQARNAARRDRMEAVQALRRGLGGGASDAELQDLLERLDRIESGQRDVERSFLGKVNEPLSIRQRVQLRFFMEHFRMAMSQKIQELRGRRGGDFPPARRRGPRRDRP